MLSKKIGIDLGTSRMRVFVKGEGVVVNEPTLMATDERGARVLAVGSAAAELLARGGKARAIRPFGDGNVLDYEVAGTMLQYLIGRIVGRQRIFRPDIMLSIGPGVNGMHRRAVLEATMQAGAKTAYLIDKPLAAAMGARLPVATTDGLLIANLGAGSTDIAAIANGEVLAMESIPIGGLALDAAIAAAVELAHGLQLQPGEAERLKLKIGSAVPQQPPVSLGVSAVDDVGRVAAVHVSATQVYEAMLPGLAEVAASLGRVLAQLTPARRGAVQRNGLILSGGGANLPGLTDLFGSQTGLPVRVAAEPDVCIARGTGMALDSLALVRRGQHYIT